jgi:hypothetical protein
MNFAGSTIWSADAGLDPGGIVGGLLCLGLVVFVAVMTRSAGRQRRRPAGAPIYRRTSPYRRRRRDSEWDDSGNSGGSSGFGGSGGSDGSGVPGGDHGGGGCGGGGGGGD